MGDDGLSISGGAGGVTAHYDDMLSYATVIDTAGDDLWTASKSLGGVLVSADFAQAAVLCPVEVGEAEFAIGEAATGPHGALLVSAELEVTARLVRWSVELYEFTDAQLAALADLGTDLAGWGTGLALPGLAVLGAGALLSNPALLAALIADPPDPQDLQQYLYDHPWLEEALTRMAPGMVQGTAYSLASLLGPDGVAMLTAMSGGNWPTGDYQSAIAGLLALAGNGGLLQDDGTFNASATGDSSQVDLSENRFLRAIFQQQGALSHHDGQVQIIKVVHNGQPSWVVQIPGTQVWSPMRGDNPVDLTTNVRLEAQGGTTKMEQAVADAMAAAGIGPHDPVMLTGHSQGGITAAAMASDPDLGYNVESVVTAGSPIGNFHIPSSVSVMSLEERQDIVPKLDGADNPDQPNWVTVTRDLTKGSPPLTGHDLGSAHSTENYAQTGQEIDASTAATIAAWRKRNQQFFGSSGDAQHYQITRTDK